MNSENHEMNPQPRQKQRGARAAALVVGLALWTEVNINPPLWLHFIIWIPLAVGLSLWLLRVLKAMLIAQQYKLRAKPGEIDHG